MSAESVEAAGTARWRAGRFEPQHLMRDELLVAVMPAHIVAEIVEGMNAAAAAVPADRPCTRCEGCGLVADSDDGEPWTAWEQLPPGSDIAVRLGLVRPLSCPECSGTGRLAGRDG